MDERKKENVEWKASDREEARVVFQRGGSASEALLVLLTSFPHCLGGGVFELLRLVEVELLRVLEANLNPFARPSSPCS